MSLAINVDKVTAVLLADGRWHEVRWADGVSSFTIDAFEFIWYGGSEEQRAQGEPTQIAQPKAESTGAEFMEDDDAGGEAVQTVVPLNYIYGVRVAPGPEAGAQAGD